MPLYDAFFTFTAGLKDTIQVPVGTCEAIRKHVVYITDGCGLKITQYKENPCHWERFEPSENIDNETASSLVRQHNDWVVWLYKRITEWSKNPPEEYEEMTPEFAATIWHGVSQLQLPVQRWSAEYYREEMQRLFDIMRGEDNDEIEWETDPLTPRQAADVIHLFDTYLDTNDIRLELPRGWDGYLLTTDEYDWCPEHGAIPIDDTEENDEGDILCPECKEILG